MELGRRLKAARLEAGLSQRRLCEGVITRNMLSQIENGSARPSMDTLCQLAGRLEKPVSYFLEGEAAPSPNRQCMHDARLALALGDLEGLEQALEAFREPDEELWEERQLLRFLWYLKKAEAALEKGQTPFAVRLLNEAKELGGLYITRELRRRNLVLLGMAGEPVDVDWDEDALLVRARCAPSPERRIEILAGAEDKTGPLWNYLQAEAQFALKRYEEAALCYEKAGQTDAVYARLEVCYRELGDYRRAYEYACLQRRRN